MVRVVSILGCGVLMALLITTGCTRTESSDNDSLVVPDETEQDSQVQNDETDPGNDNSDPGDDNVGPDPDVDDQDVTQQGTTVADIQKMDDGINCPADTAFINLMDGVELANVVVTSPKFTASNKMDGFFVADKSGGKFSGIKVVVAKDSNPPEVAVGEVLTISGDAKEYYCLTEFEASAINKKAEADPVVTTVEGWADLTDAQREEYEGVLIQVAGVAVEGLTGYGGFTVDGGLEVDNTIFEDMPLPSAGCKYTSIVGLVDYSYGKYVLLPRTADDLVLDESTECSGNTGGETTITAIQTSQISTTCTDQSFVQGGAVELKNVIIASEKMVVSKDKLYGIFAYQDTLENGPNKGVLLVWDWAKVPDYAVGDKVDVKGDWTEYYCLTEVKVTEDTKTGTQEGTLEPVVVAAADLGSAATAEQWEGCLVKIENVTVNSVTQYGEGEIDGGLLLDDSFGVNAFEQGQSFASVTGFVNYGYSKYRLLPRTNADMIAD